MKKNSFTCNVCGYVSRGYLGKCPNCNTWSSFEETVEQKTSDKKSYVNTKVKKLSEVEGSNSSRVLTGIGEFDRLMSDGVVRDSVTILTARPGAGKSTLLLQIANSLANIGYKVLYASGEESESQIKSRANRILDTISEGIYITSHSSMDRLMSEVETINPDAIILDSIQTFTMDDISARAGSPTQTMECAYKLVELAKNTDRPRMVFIVGQMTKEDELAGVRALEHLVDTVLMIDGESGEELRMLKSTKNRYGSTGEMGFFNMTEKGMCSIDNPSEYFITKREGNDAVSGSALSVQREGTRSVIVEVECLVSQSFTPYPSRISTNMSKDELNTIISIIEERAKKRLYDKNVVLKTTGGIRLGDNSSALAVAMCIVSALVNVPLPSDTVFVADLGLTGELKRVPSLKARVQEAARMGYKRAVVACDSGLPAEIDGLKVDENRNIFQLVNKYFKS